VDKPLIYIPALGWVQFESVEELHAKLASGRAALGGADGRTHPSEADDDHGRGQDGGCERLLSADELGQATGTAASWWENAASRGAVPHFKIGRYTRFRYSEVLAGGYLKGKARVLGDAQVSTQSELPAARRLKAKSQR